MAMEFKAPRNPWKPKATRVLQMWAQPCNINPLIWVAGHFAASPTFLFALVAPDCLDYVADRYRRGPRIARKPTMNISDLAKPIFPADNLTGWATFNMLRFAQRTGLYFLLVDATLDWTIMGTSMAYQWTGCKDPGVGHASVSMRNTVPELYPAAQGIIASWVRDGEHLIKAGPTGIAVPKGWFGSVGFSHNQITGQFPGLKDCSVQLRVLDLNSNFAVTPWLDQFETPDGNRVTTFFSQVTSGALTGANYVVEFQKTEGVWLCDAIMTASAEHAGGVGSSACGHNIPGEK